MTEPQFIGIMVGFAVTVLASIGATLAALLINNARLNDVKEALRGESKAEVAGLRSEMASMREAILSQMATYQLDIISKIAELDNRITRLER
jgi:hypothetical protein